MDEKQIAALREVFETWEVTDNGWDKDSLRRHPDGIYHSARIHEDWSSWLACYQHLAPMVEDAERYRWLRNPNHDIEPVIDQRDEDATIDGIPTVIYEYRSGEELDKAIDTAREQEKKTC